ncbi:MAG TPA: hypothetical protein VG148_14625 [Pyrinomonadaceae bacterium]|nr:hypothetical protein [Pyrinomonadaceae bacterium]
MKRRIFIAFVLVAAAFFVGRQVKRLKGSEQGAAAGRETRQSYRLDPGARVEVRGINGPVEVNTAETDTADVRVTYSGGGPEDGPRVVVEHRPAELVVRGEGRGGDFWRWLRGGGDTRVAVTLTVPRRSEVAAKGVNGPVEVGEVEGPVTVTGVNGRVDVAPAGGRTEVSGVNGNVKLAVTRISSEGLDVKGVNGNVEVFLRSSLDADLEVRGNNGQVTLNVPNVTMQEREGHSRMRARFGEGGAPISFKGVNGNVRFDSGAAAASTSSLPPPPPPPPAPRAPQH